MYTYILYFNYYSIFIKCVLDSIAAFLFIKTIINILYQVASVKDYYINQYIHHSAQNLKASIADITHLSTVLCYFL